MLQYRINVVSTILVMARPKSSTTTKQIVFPVGLLKLAEKRVRDLGISFPDYIRFLVLQDIQANKPTQPT